MHVEHGEKHRDAGEQSIAKGKLLGSRDRADRDHLAVGRAHHKSGPLRRHPLRIAEEIGASQCGDHAEPAERRGEQEQDQRRHGEAEDEFMAFGMDRHEGAGDAVEDGVAFAHGQFAILVSGKGFVF